MQITPALYLGSHATATSLPLLTRTDITHILNVAEGCSNAFPRHFEYLTIPCRDRSYEILSPYFAEAAAFVAKAEEDGGKVLIHCRFGISRSVAFVIATLVLNQGMSTEAALEKVRKVKGDAEPNEGFMRQLRVLDGTITADDKIQAGDALQQGVALLVSVKAVNYLPADEILVIRQKALQALEGVPVAERVKRLLELWTTVCEGYMTNREGDERARRAYGEMWREAIEGDLVGLQESKQGLEGMKDSDEWGDLRLDVPMADGFMEDLLSEIELASEPVEK